MNGTRYHFRQASITFFAVFAVLVLALNHGMLTNDGPLARLAFYALVVVVPLFLAGSYWELRELHLGRDPNEMWEGIAVLTGALMIAGLLWMVSTVFYGEPASPLDDPEVQKLIEKYTSDQ